MLRQRGHTAVRTTGYQDHRRVLLVIGDARSVAAVAAVGVVTAGPGPAGAMVVVGDGVAGTVVVGLVAVVVVVVAVTVTGAGGTVVGVYVWRGA